MRFNFGERDKPFNLSVDGVGGGGFFAIKASTAALELVEASLEFGGNIEISVFVATGEVHAMGGVSLLRSEHEIKVGGYLRCGGHLEVLEVVTVSVEFEMGLSYVDGGGEHARVEGHASVTVDVSVLLLSETVSFEVTKSFEAPAVGSPFDLEIDESAWNQLCDAFA